MNTEFLGVAWWIWGIGCLVVAGVYTIVWPRPKTDDPPRTAWQTFVLRWFHALVWVLLAAACFVHYLNPPAGLPEMLALGALVVYLVFMATTLSQRGRTR